MFDRSLGSVKSANNANFSDVLHRSHKMINHHALVFVL